MILIPSLVYLWVRLPMWTTINSFLFEILLQYLHFLVYAEILSRSRHDSQFRFRSEQENMFIRPLFLARL